MTAQETEQITVQPSRSPTTRSSVKAYDRRTRRQQALAGRRLTATGSPVAATLSRLPFVAVIILLLAGGIVGVLWLNTMSDAAGLRGSQSKLAQMDLDTQIEAAQKDIAGLKNPALLDSKARALGLVPPGDAAIIVIGPDRKATVLGTPTPVGEPTAPVQPAAAPPASAAPPAPAATTAPVVTTAPVGKSAKAAPATPAVRPPAAKPATPAQATAAQKTAVQKATVQTTAGHIKAVQPAPKAAAEKATAAKPAARAVGQASVAKTTVARTAVATATVAATTVAKTAAATPGTHR
jgi:hypothetical protein